MALAPASTALSISAPRRGISRTVTVTVSLALYPVIVGGAPEPGVGLENIGEIDRLDVWMSAGATLSPLISETSALTALALAAIVSRASLPVVVTPSVTFAKSGGVLTLASPVTSIQRSWLTSM